MKLTENNKEEFIKECIEKSKELIKLVEKYEKEGKPLEDYKKKNKIKE